MESKKMRIVSWLDDETIDKLDKLALKLNENDPSNTRGRKVSRSRAIRVIIEEYFESQNKKKTSNHS